MDPIIVKPGLTGKNNTLYIVLFVIFITLLLVAVFLFIQIQSSSKPKEITFTPGATPTVVKKDTVSPVPTLPVNDNQVLDTPEFRTEYLPDMKMTQSTFDKGKKYSFANKNIIYEVSIGTDWSRIDPARNFDNPKTTINAFPAYFFSDNKTYLGFDFVGKKSKKYVTLKCTYDPDVPGLGDKCVKLTGAFYLLGE